jgi:hypothetical protein
MNVGRLSDLCTGRLYSFLLEVLSALGSTKHPNNLFGNRTRDLPFSAVPQPNASLRTAMHMECAKIPCAPMVLLFAGSGKVPEAPCRALLSGIRDLCHVAPNPCNFVLLVYHYAFFRYDFNSNLYPTSYRCTGSIRAPI